MPRRSEVTDVDLATLTVKGDASGFRGYEAVRGNRSRFEI